MHYRGRTPEYHIAYWYRPKPGEPALIYFKPGGTLDHTYVGGVVSSTELSSGAQAPLRATPP